MEKKKKFQIPTTCALLFMLMIVCAVLTWIIPAGAYETEKVGNLNKVIAGTYHVIDSTPVGPWGVLMAVMAGFYKSAKLIFMIMFCGGAVAVLEKSGSINAAFGRLASNKKLNAHVLALLIMAFMLCGRRSRCVCQSGCRSGPHWDHSRNQPWIRRVYWLPVCLHGRLLRL